MDKRLVYVELKSGHNDRGPAWIGYCETSRSGHTIYFNDQAFRSCKGGGIGANFYDIESGDEYWISGVKKSGGDRHWAGGGRISIMRDAVDDYLDLRHLDLLDEREFQICSIRTGNIKERVQALEHQQR